MPSPTTQSMPYDDPAPVIPAGGPRLAVADLRLDALDELEAIEAEWQALASLPRNSLHQDLAWCSAWWSAHGAHPLLLRGRIDGRTVMILPLVQSRRPGLRIARFPGERFNNVNTGLFSQDFPALSPHEQAALTDLVRQSLFASADLLLLDKLPQEWAGAANPLHGLASNEHQDRSFQLPLLADMEQTIGQLNAKTRKRKYRIQCRRLEAAGGFEHVCPEGLEEQHALLDLFFRQKAQRFTAFGLPDAFQPESIRAFLHGLLNRSTEGPDHALRLHAIRLRGEHEGCIAAIAALSRKGSYALCQFSSIDGSLLPEASPGELLFWLTIEQAIEEGATVFDFGMGDQPYKRSWCSQETVMYDALLPLTWRGRLALPAFLAGSRLKAAIKKNAALYSLAQKLRALT